MDRGLIHSRPLRTARIGQYRHFGLRGRSLQGSTEHSLVYLGHIRVSGSLCVATSPVRHCVLRESYLV